MALFEMVHTRILQSAIVEKWINSLNIDLLIFRTSQYYPKKSKLEILHTNVCLSKKEVFRKLASGRVLAKSQRELSNEYQHDRVSTVFKKNLCILLLRTKVASALEGLIDSSSCQKPYHLISNHILYIISSSCHHNTVLTYMCFGLQ